MSDASVKPYLLRALYEWCVDQGYTPHIAVRVNAKTKVPQEYVVNGEIVLNISPLATHQLTMDNEWILFNARFRGMSQEVAIPMSAVIGFFAKETGYGMGFAPEIEEAATAEPGVSETVTEASGHEAEPSPSASEAESSPKGPRGRPALKVIK